MNSRDDNNSIVNARDDNNSIVNARDDSNSIVNAIDYNNSIANAIDYNNSIVNARDDSNFILRHKAQTHNATTSQTAGRYLLGYALGIRGRGWEFVGVVMGGGGWGEVIRAMGFVFKKKVSLTSEFSS